MARQLLKNDVPELWRQRAKAGLCPVCGKTRAEFKKGHRVYCSVKCRDTYASKYTYWTEIRDKVLDRDNKTCQKCGINREKFRDKDREEETRRFLEWGSKHPKTVRQWRDEALVRLDKRFKESYDEIMDDLKLISRRLDWDEKKKLTKGLHKFLEFDVDHIIPIALGGDMWDMKNLQTLCKKCHNKKTKEDLKKINSKKKLEKTMVDGQKNLTVCNEC